MSMRKLTLTLEPKTIEINDSVFEIHINDIEFLEINDDIQQRMRAIDMKNAGNLTDFSLHIDRTISRILGENAFSLISKNTPVSLGAKAEFLANLLREIGVLFWGEQNP